MVTQTEKLQSRSEIDQEYYRGLFDVANIMIQNPKQREILERFISGEIHGEFGGSLRQQRGFGTDPLVFWHMHGSFVDTRGAIYEARSDDAGVPQVYVAPNNPEWTNISCIQPWTYDVASGPYDIEMRFDFINGPNRTAPFNTLAETQLQRNEDKDVSMPRHYDGIEAMPELSRRDYLSLVKRGNGHIDGWLHDSQTDQTTRLYAPADVLATVHEMEDTAAETARLEQEYDAMRAAYVAAHLGTRAYAAAA